MKITCEIIREKLAVCINDRVDPKEDSDLMEHLEQCEECNHYYQELKNNDLELSDFADSMLPIIARIETNINKEIENQKTSMSLRRNRLLKRQGTLLSAIGPAHPWKTSKASDSRTLSRP